MKYSFKAMMIVVLACAPAGAQEMGYGEEEYLSSCAACHGDDGKGGGPLASELVMRPPDLTKLSEANGGEFPYWRVFAAIDGRHLVPGQGHRDMPAWGRQFLKGDRPIYGPLGGEAVTQERIHELAGYIHSLQK